MLEAATGRADSLAHHFFAAFAAGQGEKASEYSELAGDQATRVYASSVAVDHYRNALDIMRQDRTESPQSICRVLLKLGDAQRGIGEEAAARATSREAAALARAHGLAPLFGRAVLDFAGYFVHMRPPDAQTVALIEDAIAMLDGEAPALEAELLTRLATERCLHPDGDFLQSLRQRAYDALLASPAPDSLLHLSTTPYTGILETLVPASERAALVERSLRESAEHGTHRMRCAARMCLAAEYLASGDIARHDALLAEAEAGASQVGDPYEIAYINNHKQFRAVIDGRFDDAERLCNEAILGPLSRLDPAAARQLFMLQLGMLRIEQGRFKELMSTTGLMAMRVTDPAYGSLTSATLTAWMAMEIDDRDTAREMLDEIMRDLRRRAPSYHSWESQCAVLAHVAGELGASVHAADLFELLLPLRGRVIQRGHVGCHGPACHFLGVLADLLGRLDEALVYFEEAIALAGKLGAPTWLARIRYCEARALARSSDDGRIKRARSSAEQSREIASALGMHRIEAQAAVLLESLAAA